MEFCDLTPSEQMSSDHNLLDISSHVTPTDFKVRKCRPAAPHAPERQKSSVNSRMTLVISKMKIQAE